MTTIPFLFLAQCLFVYFVAGRVDAQSTAYKLIFPLLAWGVLSAILALTGVYDSQAFLSLLPGFWINAVPFVIVAAVMLAAPGTRTDLANIAAQTPHHWFVAIQILRISALGTLVKTVAGEFPEHIELSVGLTDLAFGFSALYVYRLVKNSKLSADALVMWHLVGILLLVIPAGMSIQAGLPGPLQTFTTPPTSEVLFDFPMVLAPSLVVPGFLLLNVLGTYAARLQPVDKPAHVEK